MDPNTLWLLLVSLLLVIANGFFVASEFAIVKVRTTRMQELADAGDARAKVALRIVSNLDTYLSANQLGVTLASLALGWLGEPAFATLISYAVGGWLKSAAVIHTLATVLAFFVVTFLHTVLGELAPKSLAIQKAELTALWCARPLQWFYLLFYPFIWFLNASARLLLRLFGLRPAAEADDAHSQAELKMVIAASHAHGSIDQSTADLVDHALDFRDRPVRAVMTPRPELMTLDLDMSLDQAVRSTAESAYSRFPVIARAQGRERLVGFVHSKDLYTHLCGVKPVQALRQLVREPILVPETMTLDRLRRQMQRRHIHVALVLDEYANFVGMATLEDVLEDLVGPIEDEMDEPNAQPVVALPDGTFEVDGGLSLDLAKRQFQFQEPTEISGIDTLGGYVFAVLEHPPVVGDTIRIGKVHQVTVLKAEQFRVRRLLIRKLADEEQEAAVTEAAADTAE